MGQTHVQRFLPELLEHIELGHLNPEAIVTHRLSTIQRVDKIMKLDE